MRRLVFGSILLLAVACGEQAPPSSERSDGCIPGRSVSCACTDGSVGAQICTDERTLGRCQCTGSGGSTGSGGTTGAGGTTANGGALGSGGTVPSGGTSAGGTLGGTPDTYADFTVVYNDDVTRHLARCDPRRPCRFT